MYSKFSGVVYTNDKKGLHLEWPFESFNPEFETGTKYQ
jgi:hypothetical protein